MRAVHRLLREELEAVERSTTWDEIQQTFELGEPRGRRLHFSAEHRRELRELAQRAWGFDPLAGVPEGNRRQVAASAIDEKIARERPNDGYVLVKGRLPPPLPSLPHELSLRVPLIALSLDGISQVVVVENLDSFDDWHAFAAPAELADSLVLYRGHGGLARGTRQLLSILPEHIPITVFTDWDPAGLRIAHTLPRADALLLPDLDEQLLAKGSRAHFARQHQAAQYLDNAVLGEWGWVWEAMKREGVSIKQQHMLALGVRLRRVARG
ncbi:hypothetical protein G3480_25580 [Thiorhodococcus mannitoliphagus]|uniref:DUF7281 domain-containing protein n=2 Tax=Thiorhodococcus mannitoliphagus TaxID=329406 RepID=A0A6P1E7Y9_9GAMM|nr:hypothetical protein [Thiorhodococcus mannitoliphagus]